MANKQKVIREIPWNYSAIPQWFGVFWP